METAILATLAATGGMLAWPRLAGAALWRATITPLASIIGSGFLVLGPIMLSNFGARAPLAMAALCLLGYMFGAAIRFNIAAIGDAPGKETRLLVRLEEVASWLLAFAYVVSVAYYLNLFGAFAGRMIGIRGGITPKLITSGIYGLILAAGCWRGFRMLERMERISVGLKLAIIAALIAGLGSYAHTRWPEDSFVLNGGQTHGTAAIQLIFGLMITVQGFETSRYLGAHYPAGLRIRSMHLSQWVSTAIYLVYVTLLTAGFRSDGFVLDETAIIDLMTIVSPLLPPLLIVAALSAQFSAAVADTGASGGLMRELTRRRVSARGGYILLVAVGLALTWVADIFQIIGYASRAFAAYYAVQAAIAAVRAHRGQPSRHRAPRVVGFALLAVLGVVVTFAGQTMEG